MTTVGEIFRNLLLVALSLSSAAVSAAQTLPTSGSATGEEAALEVPQEVEVDPVVEDTDISHRLKRIFEATDWFEQPEVQVEEGVVFLRGRVDSEQHKEWAARLAGKTQNVAAVVNHLKVTEKSMWDLSPAWSELRQLRTDFVQNSPLIGFGLVLLFLTWIVAKWSVKGAASLLQHRVKSPLLRDVAARAVAVPVFLLGLYLVLRVSGLTRLAVTVLGGTGLLGLVIGFAFRDIAENFLASILISMQHPFARGDMIEVAGFKGYVQSVNTRSTLLMTIDGNHLQIPNATIYKETITNFTANPNARFELSVGIGYEDSVADAQAVALSVLHDYPAVIDEPEPLVLVESLGAATVNLRAYYWVNIDKYSFFKVQSAIARLIKQAFEQAGISMPDEAREVVFPAGVPVRMLPEESLPTEEASQAISGDREVDEEKIRAAEGDLTSEAREIQQQANRARSPEGGANLLDNS